jgi:glycosyltransferase involved in cell wall biosynthesis
MTRKGMEQVGRDADGETNVRRIKDLVRQVAGAPAAGGDVAVLPLPRTGIVSHILPPSPSGQATVLRRLLEGFPPDRCILLSRERYDGAGDASGKLPLPYAAFHPPLRLPSFGRFPGSRIRFAGDTLLEIRGRAAQIGTIARKERLGLIVACSGDLVDIPASCLAARRTGIPFVPYLFDDYLYQWTGSMRTAARRMEPWVMKNVKDIIVPNEYLRDEYSRRYGVHANVVRNPCPMPDLAALDATARVFPPSGIDIVYAGAVYHANYDAFRNVVAAIRMLGRTDVRLHLYTAQTAEEVGKTGIAGPMVVHHTHIPSDEVPAVLRQADILFLPLGFDTPIPEVIRTSAPGKMGEYLSVGRPILVHAPGDSFVSWYFRENRCGIVVDRSDPDMLSSSIHRIFSNGDLRAGLGARARFAAERDFEVGTVRIRFMEALKAFAGRR